MNIALPSLLMIFVLIAIGVAIEQAFPTNPLGTLIGKVLP